MWVSRSGAVVDNRDILQKSKNRKTDKSGKGRKPENLEKQKTGKGLKSGKAILAGGHGGLIGPLRRFAKKRRNGKARQEKEGCGWVGLPGLVLGRDDLPPPVRPGARFALAVAGGTRRGTACGLPATCSGVVDARKDGQ
ncbi:hypothetical protein [Trichloromonas acetexigens]|uniref:Uncharacterized protein n=1 Tax=Trichloromonas acetexigens TaxID=38815 RepID=A0A550JLL6_9BACT|nr:hypothetical protein [Desulfuromonas acetexigens]TRO84105.1 hypothetical protein FL622_02690 [Desulfuromonas acetexigens]